MISDHEESKSLQQLARELQLELRSRGVIVLSFDYHKISGTGIREYAYTYRQNDGMPNTAKAPIYATVSYEGIREESDESGRTDCANVAAFLYQAIGMNPKAT